MDSTTKTIVDWFSFCHEVVIYHHEVNSEQLGSSSVIAEINELFGKWKYNRGSVTEGQQVFSGSDCGTKKIFLLPVPDTAEDTPKLAQH